ncbi:hypothetical protein SAMN06272735_5399 [Streptomyces sp. TLI_55]|uniref:hypothetical protein n=1 Tax=Streptomyces sp. TLI_55 TaxID=1938861 RepID=UPI000BC7A393|nr:hypothetical protein [Streptomyces sp. TLI_55]SNX63589.1 hypothetical protein SAMN06272735_5399 [Streptomyces sp. TLI_55]
MRAFEGDYILTDSEWDSAQTHHGTIEPVQRLLDSVIPELYGEPKGDAYRLLSAGRFGGTIAPPPPFDITLGTREPADP